MALFGRHEAGPLIITIVPGTTELRLYLRPCSDEGPLTTLIATLPVEKTDGWTSALGMRQPWRGWSTARSSTVVALDRGDKSTRLHAAAV